MSQVITLKDPHFRPIGYVEIRPNGDKVLKDVHYHIKGYYFAREDLTKDCHYHTVGRGDVLTALL